MSKRKLIWPDFIDCKVVVICENEEVARDFYDKLNKYESKIQMNKNLRFMTERYNFGWESDKINFWHRDPEDRNYDTRNYTLVSWKRIMEFDNEMRMKRLLVEVSNGN